jgi:SAM-dependent methyltransferase/uncharacterized protein YbaR (Trm112 family)
MRTDFADRLRCPRCRTPHPFELRVDAEDAQEVRAGALTCSNCGLVATIADGIVELMHDPPDFVVREADGLGRFAQFMRDDGWTKDTVLELPNRHDGYWWAQSVMMSQVLETETFERGETILDLGSNTCWASTELAKAGLAPTALDISLHEMQGLRTADWQFEAKDVFFERVLAMMFDMPFADGSFDNVWACEVLHHNHRANLVKTFEECFRVLRPGGRLIVVNEPLRTVNTPKLRPGHEVKDFEGHEHAYMRFSYTTLAKRAGFDIDVRGPWINGLFWPQPIGLSERMTDFQIVKATAAALIRRHPRLKSAALANRAYIRGGTSLHMICTKP